MNGTRMYAIFAPGVGYRTGVVREKGRWSYDIDSARTFATVAEVLQAVRDGETDRMSGLEIRIVVAGGLKDMGSLL